MDELIPIVSFDDQQQAGTSMDFSGLFGSMFGQSGYNSESMNDLMSQYMRFIRENTDYNNAWSAQQAERQMDFQAQSQQIAQQFNAEEAARNRNWQQYMSSSAHQREVADLKAAGLNPVLSAMGGNGASVTSGATASSQAMSGSKGDGDQSGNAAIVNILGTAFSALTSLASKNIDAQTSMAVATKYTEMERIIEGMREEYSRWEHENYPSSMYEAISAVIGLLSGSNESNPLGSILFGDSGSSGSSGLSGFTHGSSSASTVSGLLGLPSSSDTSSLWDRMLGKAKSLGVPDRDYNFLQRISQYGFEDKNSMILHVFDYLNHPKLWNGTSLQEYLSRFRSRQGDPGSRSRYRSGEGFSGKRGKF